MNGIKHIFGDWKRLLHHKHGRVALGFLLLVPLIYLGLFLSGYWNPYGNLDKLPVAIVNQDLGATMDGEPIHAGEDFVEELKNKQTMDFRFVSAEQAKSGLKDGTYYMVVTVPKDFSAAAASLMDENPKQAQLLYETNAGRNFVASQVGTSAVKEMKAGIQESLTKAYADGVLSSMQRMADGLGSAGSGAVALHEGTEKAYSGLQSLASGAHQLTSGTDQLQGGSDKLATATSQLKQGAESASKGSTDLAEGLVELDASQQTLTRGSEQSATGMNELAVSSHQAADAQKEAAASLAQLKKALAAYAKSTDGSSDDQVLQSLVKQLGEAADATQALALGQQKLAAGADKLADGQQKLAGGMEQLGSGISSASAGADRLQAGTTKLSSGLISWEDGFHSLHSGITGLASGASNLSNGSDQLLSGIRELNDGTGELSTKLAEANNKTAALRTGSGVAAMFAEPVQLVESDLHEIPNYGVGIAPYFLSLALFVGGIMGANILPLGRRQDFKLTGTAQWINKLGLFYTVGIVQTLIVIAIALFGFGIEPTSVPGFIGFCLLASLTFLTIIYMLLTLFGFVGKFLSVTLLVLQLASCGGTFPSELNLPIMQAIGRWVPMTFSLHGLQNVISIGDRAAAISSALALLAWLIGAAVISLAFNVIHARRELQLAKAESAVS
ncbi:YhgE/Pip domain-containing protein [Paenibacillus sp. Marseille-Q4541]|uniref:YhgE/Pip family protein n=1 Tax=Paenibacillus sp. Marseille-Q4541 TaxID=2831522 RepID=UPI001BADFB99